MKIKYILSSLLMVGFLALSCKNNESTTSNTKEIASVEKLETATFTISGMSCAVMCANTIEKKLSKLEGVKKAKVDFEKKLATVKFDIAVVSPEKIVSTVEAVAGGDVYKVSDLKCSANKAMLFQDEEKKSRKERRAERKAKKEAEKTASKDSGEEKKGCCSGKKHCSKDKEEKSGTM